MAATLGLAIGVLVWLLVPAAARTPARVDAAAAGRGAGPRRGARPLVLLVGVVMVVVLGLVIGPGLLPWLVIFSVVGGTTAVLVSRSRSHRRAGATAQQVARGCQVLAGQLRIGQIPVVALQTAAEDCPVLNQSAAAHQVGGDIAEAMRHSGDEPGASGLRSLAAAWQLAERSGAPMAEAAERVAVQLTERAALRRSVANELAPARATGKLLAGLPLVGIAMGFMVGGSPDEFLVANTIGRWLLAAAVTLACAGVLWTEWIADHVERRTR